jgi:histidine triad (HIT) family protein
MTHHHTSSDDCLFCRIARGDVPSHAVYEDERIFAFLDINPIRPGHTQIVPRDHHPYFDDLPPDLAAEIVHFGQRLASVLKRTYGVHRAGFVFTGGDIAHVHAHVVPLVEKTDITSRRYIAEDELTFRSAPRVPNSELAATSAQLRAALAD